MVEPVQIIVVDCSQYRNRRNWGRTTVRTSRSWQWDSVDGTFEVVEGGRKSCHGDARSASWVRHRGRLIGRMFDRKIRTSIGSSSRDEDAQVDDQRSGECFPDCIGWRCCKSSCVRPVDMGTLLGREHS